LQNCGRFCAKQHSTDLFKKLKEETNNLNELFAKLNEDIKETKWKIIDDHTATIEYEKCFCPIHALGIVDSAIQCNCSTGWIKENLELYLEKLVEVTLEHSVLQGYPSCKFVAQY